MAPQERATLISVLINISLGRLINVARCWIAWLACRKRLFAAEAGGRVKAYFTGARRRSSIALKARVVANARRRLVEDTRQGPPAICMLLIRGYRVPCKFPVLYAINAVPRRSAR